MICVPLMLVDGIYSDVPLDDRLGLRVIIGVTEKGRTEFVTVKDGDREPEASWRELLQRASRA